MDRYQDLDPDEEEVVDAEFVVADDVLVKAFALGPGAELDPHDHPDATNVFHVLEGPVTVIQGDPDGESAAAEVVEGAVAAPGVVHHARGVVHGARNGTDDRAVLTASLCPLP
jgi:quercetin dioxygenase-like cupin family protein